MKNFAQIQAQRIADFKAMKAKFAEEYYALRKCVAEVILGEKVKASRKTHDGAFRVGVKVLDYPTLFIRDAQNEYRFKMTELEGYFQHGHIRSDLWEHQKDDVMKIAFRNINEFLQQFN